MNQLIIALATGFYVGKIPKAPGTWGSLAALIPWFFFKDVNLYIYMAILVATFVLGYLVSGSAEKLMAQKDPGSIVIDEVLGIFITLIMVPDHPAAWVLGFVLFRLFDILKPYPVSLFDKNFHGGMGIMLDDVAAGIYALISLQIIWQLFLLFS